MREIRLLPATSAIIIVTFALLVFWRYVRSGGLHLLLWGVGLSMFAVVSLAEVYLTLGWHPTAFRLWYLCGAVLSAAWLGEGTVVLLSGARSWTARVTLLLLLVGTVAAASLVLTVPLQGERFQPSATLSAQYRDILPPGAVVRRLTPIFNIYGTVTLIGGALYSAWLLWRRQTSPQRVIGNILIAGGGLSLAFASTLVRLGFGDVLYLAELIAAVLMFAGFLAASAKRVGPASPPVSVQ